MTLDIWIAIIYGGVTLYLMYRSNILLREQNRIMVQQSDQGHISEATTPSNVLQRYWPIMAMAILVLLSWSAVGTWIVIRHAEQTSALTTTGNVESKIKAWAEKFHLTIQTQPDDPKQYFAFMIIFPDGVPIVVARMKDSDQYLVFETQLNIAPDDQAFLAKIPQDQMLLILHEITLELAQERIGYLPVLPPLKVVTLLKMVPITNSLTEAAFADALSQIDSALAAARETTIIAIARTKQIQTH